MRNQCIGLISRVFPNSTGDQGSIPGWVIAKTKKMVLDAAVLITSNIKYGSRAK